MKKLCLSAALACFPFAAGANDVSVYGRAHVSLDALDNGGNYSELNIISNASRIGFRANQAVEGLTAFVQVERSVDFDNGDAFTGSRNTFVGLRGDFGQVRVGYFDTPFKAARGPANLFGDELGDMRNLTRVGDARFDERWSNQIHYQTPSFGGAKLNLAYTVSEPQTAQSDGKDEAVSASLTYGSGPLEFTAAYESYGEERTNGERSGARVAAAYELTTALSLVGFFQSVDYPGSDAWTSETVGIGGQYKFTDATSLRGQYITRTPDIDDADANMISVGIEHLMGEVLRVYGTYGLVANGDLSALVPYNQGRSISGIPEAPGEDASGFSAGMVYRF